jgi:CelD/BcsL family acetyltransferase involved in cellulose biosynthesis
MAGQIAQQQHNIGLAEPINGDDGTRVVKTLAGALTVTAVPAAQLPDTLLPEWAELSRRSAEPNIFAEPALAVAALRHCASARGAQILLVRDAVGALLGIVPVTRADHFGRIPVPCLTVWSHPNGFLAPVAMAAGHESQVWQAVIAHLRSAEHRAGVMLVTGLPENSAAALGLANTLSAQRLRWHVEEKTVRAMLATTLPADTYWDQAVRAKKRKELRRQWARLNECGVIEVSTLGPDCTVDSWIEEFLALEAAGWKGQNHSALASHADTAAFFRHAMTSAHAARQLAITALRLDGRAIAMLITLIGIATRPDGTMRQAGFSFKTAFDEDFARYSPGVLLQRESLALLEARGLDWIDSCAAQDHPMIDSLWRERRTIVSGAFPLPGWRNAAIFALLCAATDIWHWVKDSRRADPPATRPEQDETSEP